MAARAETADNSSVEVGLRTTLHWQLFHRLRILRQQRVVETSMALALVVHTFRGISKIDIKVPQEP